MRRPRQISSSASSVSLLQKDIHVTCGIDELPNKPKDIDVTVSIGGCRRNPTFFPLPLEDVAATVRYAKNSVWISNFQGRHERSVVQVRKATVYLKPAGGFWARLDTLQCNPLVIDRAFQRALPPSLLKMSPSTISATTSFFDSARKSLR